MGIRRESQIINAESLGFLKIGLVSREDSWMENRKVHILSKRACILRDGIKIESFDEYILQVYSCTLINGHAMIFY